MNLQFFSQLFTVYWVDSCDFLLYGPKIFACSPPQTVVLPYVKLFNQEIITPPSPPNRLNSKYYNQASSKFQIMTSKTFGIL